MLRAPGTSPRLPHHLRRAACASRLHLPSPPQVLNALATKGLHRVYIVDAAGAPVSIVTLTDFLRLVTRA